MLCYSFDLELGFGLGNGIVLKMGFSNVCVRVVEVVVRIVVVKVVGDEVVVFLSDVNEELVFVIIIMFFEFELLKRKVKKEEF